MSVIQEENRQSGTTEWQLENPVTLADRDDQFRTAIIEGYASLTSVNKGETITFHVSSTQSQCDLKIYRMGYYNGNGGRLMYQRDALPCQPRVCPERDHSTGFIECDWPASHTLTVPTDWVSGVYLAKLTVLHADGAPRQNYIIFVVRDDNRSSAYLMQLSVTTWQAYNFWGGESLYESHWADVRQQATKVSFNRPYVLSNASMAAKGAGAGQFLFKYAGNDSVMFAGNSVRPANGTDTARVGGWEYNMIRWLEREGYDVTYCTNIDVHRDPMLLLSHRAFFSVGHDEYWSRDMRLNVERARDQGVSLAFFSGNQVYGQVLLEPATTGGQAPYRTIVGRLTGSTLTADSVYSAMQRNQAAAVDLIPYPNIPTGFDDPGGVTPANVKYGAMTWGFDNPVSWPRDSLIGCGMWYGGGERNDLEVIMADHWMFAGTNLANNTRLPNLGGYEFNWLTPTFDPNTGTEVAWGQHCPMDMKKLTRVVGGGNIPERCFAVEYTSRQSGAAVFSANTVQWSWGLDDFTLSVGSGPENVKSEAVQTMVRNFLKRAVLTNDGLGQLFTTDGNGGWNRIGNPGRGGSSTWRTIVSGKFQSSSKKDLLFYDPLAGNFSFWTALEDGQLWADVPEGTSSTRKTWRHIVPGHFSESRNTDLVCYDELHQILQFYQVAMGRTMPKLRACGPPISGVAQYWHTIIPGKFSAGPYDDLFIYDAVNGQVSFRGHDGNSPLGRARATYTGCSPRWHQIIPATFPNAQYPSIFTWELWSGQV